MYFIQLMDEHNSFLRTVNRLYDKGLSNKTVWKKLIQNWASILIWNNIDQDSEEITFNEVSLRHLSEKG